jgi:hypothetical protein
MARKTSKMGGFTVTEILIVVVLIVLIAICVGTQSHVGDGHGSPANACISNLRFIDGAKGQWALEFHKELMDIPTGRDIQPYLGRGPTEELPVCPNDPRHTFDSSYSVNNIRTKPTCKIIPATHSLP